jgi:hypothetical protein
MENQNEKETPPPIIDQLKDYAETQIKLAKLEAIDKSSKFLASFIADMMVAVIFVLAFLFISFALAFLLGELLHCRWGGFACMAGIYVIVGLVIIWKKDKVETPLVNLFIKKFLN